MRGLEIIAIWVLRPTFASLDWPAMIRRLAIGLGKACSCGLIALGAAAVAQVPEQRALDAVRAEIEALEARLARDSAALEREYGALERAELASAEATASLLDVRARVAENEARGEALAIERAAIERRLGGERGALAAQVRMSYLSGREEAIKLLFNQQDPARLGRMMTYYDYLNRTRAERIEAVAGELEALAEIAAESARVAEALAALERDRQAEAENLARLRAERAEAVAALDATIDSDQAAIARLESEESRLSRLVQELNAVLADFAVDSQAPFSEIRGTLPWPVAGELLNGYGEARAGPDVRWRGVEVGAAAGTAVRAIYHGQIVYADWFPGLGLLTILDHGEGYMSLYGYNEALFKETGEWVTAGEAIAQVGDSGGQARTALYFEIREDGEPVDPRRWLGRAAPSPP